MRLLPTMRKGTHAQHNGALRDSGSRGASDKTVDIFTCRQKRQKRKKMDLRFSPKFANQTTPNSGRLSIQLRVRPRILFEYLQRAGFLQHLEGPWRMDHWKWREDCYRRRWSDLFKDVRQSSGTFSISLVAGVAVFTCHNDFCRKMHEKYVPRIEFSSNPNRPGIRYTVANESALEPNDTLGLILALTRAWDGTLRAVIEYPN